MLFHLFHGFATIDVILPLFEVSPFFWRYSIIDSLSLNSKPTALELTPEGSSSYSSERHIIVFLHLGTPESTSALCLGVILNSKITNKRHKNVKNVALYRLGKAHLFYGLKTEAGRHHLVWPQLGTCKLDIKFFCHFIQVYEWPREQLHEYQL